MVVVIWVATIFLLMLWHVTPAHAHIVLVNGAWLFWASVTVASRNLKIVEYIFRIMSYGVKSMLNFIKFLPPHSPITESVPKCIVWDCSKPLFATFFM